MTIKELRLKKHQAAVKIANILDDFQSEAGVPVDDLQFQLLDATRREDNETPRFASMVKLSVRL